MFARLPRPNYSCPSFRRALAFPIPQPGANATIPVRNPIRIPASAWLIIPLCAFGFFIVTSGIWLRRVEYVSEVFGKAGAGGFAPSRSAAWRPALIVPGHRNESFEWLDQTRQMFARAEWRVRHVDYENAPSGHDVHSASPYRWWLGLVAWVIHELTGSPIDRSIEGAALYADPLLFLLIATGTTAFVALRFGFVAAALLSAGLVTLFPFAAEFLPGAPDSRGLAQACALWSVLPLLVGAFVPGSEGEDRPRWTRRWFFAAGVAGGIGLWISASNQVPILAGIALGALLAGWVARANAMVGSAAARESLPWRAWALAGGLTCLCAYLAEFFPGHMGSWELRAVHPVIGIAWIGGGELLARPTERSSGSLPRSGPRDWAVLILAIAALLSLPASMLLARDPGFLGLDLPSMRLSMLPGGVSAKNTWAWLLQNGPTAAFLATVVPVMLVAPAAWMLLRGKLGLNQRQTLAIALGPVLVMLGFAFWRLNLWNGLDSALLALVVAIAAATRGAPNGRLLSGALAVLAAIVLLPGAVQLWPSMALRPKGELTKGEVVGLIERDLAYDLAKHVGPQGAIILAPPDATTALYYYGGIKGLGTFDRENGEGLAVAIRIAGASTPEEAQDLMGQRGVTHIIIPQWDSYMDVYALLGSGQTSGTFLERLRHWNLPPWLRPVPYLIPAVAGFEGQSVTVLKVVDPQNDAAAASRLAEYFVDMGQLDLAARAAQELSRFPADLGAQLARAQVAIAEGDADGFGRTVDILLRRIAGGSDRALPWDQRVGLAIVLAQAHHADLARAQLRQCVAEVDEEKLRSLSTNLLYSLQEARRILGVEIADPRMQETALDLLPSDLRARLEK
jgi:hypothetical protein